MKPRLATASGKQRVPRRPAHRTGTTAVASGRSGLRITHDGPVVTLRLDRPAHGNRIDLATAQELCAVADDIQHDETIRVVLLESGGASFCQGVEGSSPSWSIDWVEAVAALPCPTVCVVQGDAIAEGMELALACDIRLASRRASFAMPQIGEGRLPQHGGSQRLPRLIGRGRALDLLLSGRRVDAREALAMGLVTRTAEHTRLRQTARALIADLARKGPLALRYAKEAVWKGSDMSLDQGIRLEEDLYVLLQTSSDRREGVRAFLEKRKPRFRGE